MNKKAIWGIVGVVLVLALYVLVTNLVMVFKTKGDIITDLSKAEKTDAIIVLSQGVENGNPGSISKARLDKAADLYNRNIASTIIVAGGSKEDKIDEPTIMKNYLVKKGIPESAVKVSYAGHSTYDIIKKVHDDYKVNKVFVVTQKYHMYRSLYIADKLGMTAYGYEAVSDDISFTTKVKEIFARSKDFIKVIF